MLLHWYTIWETSCMKELRGCIRIKQLKCLNLFCLINLSVVHMLMNINLVLKLNIVLVYLCTNVLKQTIDYYTERGSYVFCSFVDFSKAFDRINYWKFFSKLLDDNVAYDVVRLLSFWYSNQSVSARWQNTQSVIWHPKWYPTRLCFITFSFYTLHPWGTVW